jgi:hypothetical protein
MAYEYARSGGQLNEGLESSVDLAFGAGLQDLELHPLRARRFLKDCDGALDKRGHRVHEQADQSRETRTLRWRKTDSNSRSLREGKGYGQPLQASIVVSDLNL